MTSQPFAWTGVLLTLLAGCSSGPTGKDAPEIADPAPIQPWTGPGISVGDVWSQAGFVEPRNLTVENPRMAHLPTGDLAVVVLNSTDRSFFLDARSGLLMGMAPRREGRDVWQAGGGGWIGFKSPDAGLFPYVALALPERVVAPFDFEFGGFPYRAIPHGEYLNLQFMVTREHNAYYEKLDQIWSRDNGTTFDYQIGGHSIVSLSKQKAGDGPRLSFSMAETPLPHRRQQSMSIPDRLVNEIPGGESPMFSQMEALAAAQESPEWPGYARYQVRVANYSVVGPVPPFYGPQHVPVFQNETWRFVLQNDSTRQGVEFVVSRLQGPVPLKPAVWGFAPRYIEDTCESVPTMRNDPLLLARQLEAAGWRVDLVGSELLHRPPPSPGPPDPYEYGGQTLPLECDWHLSAMARRVEDEGEIEGFFPGLHGGGWQSGDGLLFM